MNMFKSTLAALAVTSSLLAAAPANAVLTNWYLDTNGAAAGGLSQVAQYVDLTGRAYAHNTFTSGTTFNFDEFGTFNAFSADQTTVLSPSLTAEFFGTGSGTTGGALNFGTGSLSIFSGATNIANFNLLSGSATLNAGTVLPNGAISLIFQATSLANGYFFTSGMQDLADLLAGQTIVFGFATTNAIPIDGPVSQAIVDGYNANFGPDILTTVPINQITDVYISNNGQFQLALPEPGSLALMGIGLLGLALGSRRKQA